MLSPSNPRAGSTVIGRRNWFVLPSLLFHRTVGVCGGSERATLATETNSVVEDAFWNTTHKFPQFPITIEPPEAQKILLHNP